MVTPSQTGIVVDLAVTTAMVREEIQKGLKEPVHITAAVAVSEPAKTTEMLSQIQDVLGTFSTDFSSSSRARATNLQVGSSKINGRVLMPGETLSGYECMQPFTTANGYATAAAYENGQVVDSVGGMPDRHHLVQCGAVCGAGDNPETEPFDDRDLCAAVQ